MPYYSEEIVNDVIAKNDIVDVMNEYGIGLKKAGSEWKCCCPFHHEKTPSFSVSRRKQLYHCFGCGEGGGVVTFVMKYDNLSYLEALQKLASRVGINLPERELSQSEKIKLSKRQMLYQINEQAAVYYYYLLMHTERGQQVGLKYYKEIRRFTDETIKKFHLGYADIQRDDLYQFLKKKGYSDDIMRDSGLVDFDERSGAHDKFWNRVMVPIADINGKIIGFGGRVLGDGKPKYINTKETDIFDKSRNLFGMYIARHSRRKGVILCEGYMDVISQQQAGFDNAVASLGTSFTQGQAGIIKRYTNEVYLAYDSDEAGLRAASRAIEILRSYDMSQRVISMQPYKDPDEFIKNLGAEAYDERLKDAKTGRIFEIERLKNSFDINDPEEKTKFMHETAEILAGINDIAERNNYIDSISALYAFHVDDMKKLVTEAGLHRKNKNEETDIDNSVYKHVVKREKKDPYVEAQKTLLTIMTNEQDLFKKLDGIVTLDDFSDSKVGKVAEYVYDEVNKGKKVVPAEILNHFEDAEIQTEVSSMFTEELEFEVAYDELEKAINDLIIKIKIGNIEKLQKEGKGGSGIELARKKNKVMQLKIHI